MSTPISPSWNRLLIAVDDSQPSAWALQVGIQLAERLGARVMVVHVVEPLLPDRNGFLPDPEVETARRQLGCELLKRLASTIGSNIEVTTSLRTGMPTQEIVELARAWQPDLLIMGTRGRGRIAQFVMGSTAEDVIRRAPCPVVAVAHPPSVAGAPQEEWTEVGADCAAPLSAHERPN